MMSSLFEVDLLHRIELNEKAIKEAKTPEELVKAVETSKINAAAALVHINAQSPNVSMCPKDCPFYDPVIKGCNQEVCKYALPK